MKFEDLESLLYACSNASIDTELNCKILIADYQLLLHEAHATRAWIKNPTAETATRWKAALVTILIGLK